MLSSRNWTAAEWRVVVALSLVIVTAASLPYVLAYRVPGDRVFGGILLNPADGNSYFAKMREGWRGEWLFTLPYTAEPGQGAFIFTYYLFLGHLARGLGLSLDGVYHGARALGGLSLLFSAYVFIAHFVDTPRWRLAAWLLYCLGSGLGWLAVPLGRFTSDLWVAEAIPFLAVFSNAHFALATSLLLWILLWTLPELTTGTAVWRRWLAVALATTALGLVLPLALIDVGLVLAGVLAWRLATCRDRRLAGWLTEWSSAAVFGLCALPWLAYDAALTVVHPVLAQWNAQNVTASPPLWDALLSGGALLLLALAGTLAAARLRRTREAILVIWLGLGSLALYAPFALQRRLSLGLWMPLALLAVIALRDLIWLRLPRRVRPLAVVGLGLAVLPSNLLVYGAALGAIAARDPAIYLTHGEAAALEWLAAHGSREVVAAAPDLSLFVPARSDARVVYGHPFETVDAPGRRRAVEEFYAGARRPADFVAAYGVSYVLYGPRERALGRGPAPGPWRTVFDQEGVAIYAP